MVDVLISAPNTPETQIRCKGTIETGAGITCIPIDIVIKLNLKPVEMVCLRDFKGNVSKEPLFYVNITIGNFNYYNITVVSSRSKNALIGRDILNQLIITLNGKELTFEIKDK